LEIIHKVYDQAGISMKTMATVPLTTNRLQQYFKDVMPLSLEDEAERERVKTRHHRLMELFETGDGNDLPGVRGTLWGAYNAVTQWVDRESYSPRTKEPLKNIWFGQGRLLKERAYTVASQMIQPSLN